MFSCFLVETWTFCGGCKTKIKGNYQQKTFSAEKEMSKVHENLLIMMEKAMQEFIPGESEKAWGV